MSVIESVSRLYQSFEELEVREHLVSDPRLAAFSASLATFERTMNGREDDETWAEVEGEGTQEQ